MGAWGIGSFDNDSARDFVQEIVEDGSVALREAFEVVLDPDLNFVEAEEGHRTLAAAEVLAAVLTGDTSRLTDAGLRAWVAGADAAELAGLRGVAHAAVSRVLTGDSELPDLWADAGDEAAWRAEVERVRGALG